MFASWVMRCLGSGCGGCAEMGIRYSEGAGRSVKGLAWAGGHLLSGWGGGACLVGGAGIILCTYLSLLSLLREREVHTDSAGFDTYIRYLSALSSLAPPGTYII